MVARILEILLPSTDRLVALEFAAVVALAAIGLWMTRRDKDLRRLVLGVSLLTMGVMAVRAIH